MSAPSPSRWNSRRTSSALAALALLVLGTAADTAHATPVTVTATALAPFPCEQNPILPQMNVDELGVVPFPADELIVAFGGPVVVSPCTPGANGTVLQIINTTTPPTPFTDLYYVASPGTTFLNWEMFINGEMALKIDQVGTHQPLIQESGVVDGIFSPGESWRFVLENWTNVPNPNIADLDTPGIVGTLDVNASGSIIARPIPEPHTLVLACMFVASLAARQLHRRLVVRG